MDIRRIYEYALQREYEGKRFFQEYAARLSHAAAIEAFQALALEEQKHIEYIQAHLEALKSGSNIDSSMDSGMDSPGLFSRRAVQEAIDQSVAEAMVPDLPVLRMAYLIERDFAEFYETTAQQFDGEEKKVFLTLAEWERRHEQLFKTYHDRAFEIYSQMPWGG
jgi:rubrerythrin